MNSNRIPALLFVALLFTVGVASAQAITRATKIDMQDLLLGNTGNASITDVSWDGEGDFSSSRIAYVSAESGGDAAPIDAWPPSNSGGRDASNWITGKASWDSNRNGGRDAGQSGFEGAIIEENPFPNDRLSGKSNDLRVHLTAYHPTRPGDIVDFHLQYLNAGSKTLNATVKFLPDELLSVLQSSPAANKTLSDTLIWKFSNLAPQAQGSILISCMAPSTPTISLGDTLLVEAWIGPVKGDADPEDNYDLITQVVVGAYDHNHIQVQPAGDIAIANVADGMWLDYTIRFQNTGTDTVLQVIVHDSLDANLDISTLEMLASSHGYRLDLSEPGILAWHFNHIQLPDSHVNKHASHGFIRYRIRPKTTLIEGQTIQSRAGIYYDSDPPILTNTTLNTVVKSTLVAYREDRSMVARVYPNPSSEQIYIEADVSSAGMMTADVICDIQGRSIKTFFFRQYAGKQVHLADISDLPIGIYFLHLAQNGHTIVIELVVD